MMRYQYCPNDPQRYATNLRREQGTRNLLWDNARGQDVLLVQTPFEADAVGLMDELCRQLEKLPALPTQYTQVQPNIWLRFVTAADKARMGGCPLHAEACSYTVFSCCVENGVCSIFAPQKQAMISASCNIPMEVHICVAAQTKMEGLFKKRAVSTGYYTLSFPNGFQAEYVDGDLMYRVKDLVIPITGQMVGQGTVYIKTETRPEVISRNKGLKLT